MLSESFGKRRWIAYYDEIFQFFRIHFRNTNGFVEIQTRIGNSIISRYQVEYK